MMMMMMMRQKIVLKVSPFFFQSFQQATLNPVKWKLQQQTKEREEGEECWIALRWRGMMDVFLSFESKVFSSLQNLEAYLVRFKVLCLVAGRLQKNCFWRWNKHTLLCHLRFPQEELHSLQHFEKRAALKVRPLIYWSAYTSINQEGRKTVKKFIDFKTTDSQRFHPTSLRK